MCKMVLSTVGAFMLLCTALLGGNSQAIAHSTIFNLGSMHPLIQRVACPDDKGNLLADDACGDNKHLVCNKQDNGDFLCKCGACPGGGGHGVCPASNTICCPPGTCCHCPPGVFKCCPR